MTSSTRLRSSGRKYRSISALSWVFMLS
jgi:hypothetical protein